MLTLFLLDATTTTIAMTGMPSRITFVPFDGEQVSTTRGEIFFNASNLSTLRRKS